MRTKETGVGNCLTLGVGNYVIAPLGNYLTLQGLRLGNYLIADTDAVYVLHAFQKRSKRGIKTPSREMDVVRSRLRMAQESRQGEARRKGDADI